MSNKSERTKRSLFFLTFPCTIRVDPKPILISLKSKYNADCAPALEKNTRVTPDNFFCPKDLCLLQSLCPNCCKIDCGDMSNNEHIGWTPGPQWSFISLYFLFLLHQQQRESKPGWSHVIPSFTDINKYELAFLSKNKKE